MITINENTDSDVVRDLIYGFEKAYPTINKNYKHFEGNSHTHLKLLAIGASQYLILSNGELILGSCQDVYFCEYDGSRKRKLYVKIILD